MVVPQNLPCHLKSPASSRPLRRGHRKGPIRRAAQPLKTCLELHGRTASCLKWAAVWTPTRWRPLYRLGKPITPPVYLGDATWLHDFAGPGYAPDRCDQSQRGSASSRLRVLGGRQRRAVPPRRRAPQHVRHGTDPALSDRRRRAPFSRWEGGALWCPTTYAAAMPGPWRMRRTRNGFARRNL